MEATGTTLIEAEPRAVLEWILDLERYRQADPKVGPVKEPVRLDEEGLGRVRYRGRLVGVPTPVDTQDVHLERWHRLTLTGAPGVWTRWFVDFEGTFECERHPGHASRALPVQAATPGLAHGSSARPMAGRDHAR